MQSDVAAAGLRDLLLLFCGKRRLMRVEGLSMWPTLRPSDRLLVKPFQRGGALPSPGQILVCRHPQKTGVIITKRLISIDRDRMILQGDNPEMSTDSRQFGSVPIPLLIGEVMAKVPMPGKADT